MLKRRGYDWIFSGTTPEKGTEITWNRNFRVVDRMSRQMHEEENGCGEYKKKAAIQ